MWEWAQQRKGLKAWQMLMGAIFDGFDLLQPSKYS
jgi:hypothetical protein